MKKNQFIFILGFIVLFVFGGLFELGINQEQVRIEEEKNSVIHLADKLGAYRMERDEVTFLTDGATKIIDKMNVTNKAGALVAIIYTGETVGKEAGLQVAFAIDVVTHKIVGMKIVSSNETPSYQGELLADQAFIDQFNAKDMTQTSFDVDIHSGATLTSTGIQKIMQLVRKQYDQDTPFTAPADIIIVSKVQDMTNLNQFQYEFLIGEESVTCVVDKLYALVSISNPAHETLVMATIAKNHVTSYIDSVVDNAGILTITIHTMGYTSNGIVSTATVNSEGTILTFTSNLTNETYDNEYNGGYVGGSFQPVFDAVVSDSAIVAVSGATYTTNGIIAARDVLRAYILGGILG